MPRRPVRWCGHLQVGCEWTKVSGAGNGRGSAKLSKRRYSGGTHDFEIPDVNGKSFSLCKRAVCGYEKDKPGRAGDENHGFTLSDGNGGLTPSVRTQELEKRSADSATASR